MLENRTNDLADKNLIVKALKSGEIEAVLRIEAACGFAQSKPSDYDRALNDANNIIKVALINTETIGFIEARLITPILEVVNIAVLPEFRSAGVGGKLLRAAFETADESLVEEVWLEVRASNDAAIRFYAKHNFKIVGTRRDYYSAPVENALLMSLKFSDSSK